MTPSASPSSLHPHGKTTNIVHVRNLVRPFTLVQLKELLNRTGTVVEEGFWIDKIKSHCYVTYSSTEEAVATRVALHGVRWPQSNPKFLSVEFCEQEELDFHRGVLVSGQGTEEDAGSSVGLGPPPSLLPARERDRARDRERERDREKDRERDRERERERDRGERDQWAQREWEMRRRERTRAEREWDRDKVKPGEERGAGARRSPSHDRERRHKERKNDKKEEAPAKLLDDLFYKTKTSPCIYWLHLTEQQALQRDAERAERMKERERRRKEEEEAQKGGVLARDRETVAVGHMTLPMPR
ncbi:hypothetical protein AGOR_G00187150 [Albula goreensis]|uniref:Apoptotic chromatin condensation inducer in the nucleus n=1 Tax=Albula goreensis TaxID=1534307 RepID=A0A8T3CY78_9TELE|nr:hypothetical protein AGOR_G00187150 [Albula goreensis]